MFGTINFTCENKAANSGLWVLGYYKYSLRVKLNDKNINSKEKGKKKKEKKLQVY